MLQHNLYIPLQGVKKIIRTTRRNYTIIVIVLVSLIYIPIGYMVLVALTPHEQVFLTLAPRITFDNFMKVLSNPEIMQTYKNSWIICSFTVLITLCLSSLAGYGLSRFRVKVQGFLIISALITQMLPMELLAIGYFPIIKDIGLYNTRTVLVLLDTTICLPFSILILKSTFDAIPKEMDEAAMIDGCSRISLFLKIVLPLTRGGLFAVGVYTFLMSWGEYLYALVFTTDARVAPVTVETTMLLGHFFTKWEIMMALGIISIIPIVAIFIAFQGAFIKGLVAGSIK